MRHSVLYILITAILVLPVVGIANDAPSQGTVNLNTATAEQLQLLPRVGPALASQIINFRESNGPFRSVDELLAVKTRFHQENIVGLPFARLATGVD